MSKIIFLILVAFAVALYFYPMSEITAIGTGIADHLIEQAKK